MVRLIQKKLSGATLIEVIIAMVIIMMVFSIAIGIFNRVLMAGVSPEKLMAQQQLAVFAHQVKEHGGALTYQLDTTGISYTFKVTPTENEGIAIMEIQAARQLHMVAKTRFYYQIKRNAAQN